MLHTILKPGLAVALTLGLVSPAVAGSAPHEVFAPDQIEWGDGPDFIEPGAELVVLAGDPAAGPFTVRLRLPEGFDIHSHTHPEPKYLTVVEGAMHIDCWEGAALRSRLRRDPAPLIDMLDFYFLQVAIAGTGGGVTRERIRAPATCKNR